MWFVFVINRRKAKELVRDPTNGIFITICTRKDQQSCKWRKRDYSPRDETPVICFTCLPHRRIMKIMKDVHERATMILPVRFHKWKEGEKKIMIIKRENARREKTRAYRVLKNKDVKNRWYLYDVVSRHQSRWRRKFTYKNIHAGNTLLAVA